MTASYATQAQEKHDRRYEDYPRVSRKGTLLSGENRTAMTVLGKMDRDTVGAVTAGGGNTGNGVPGTATLGKLAEVGTYTLTCVETATNAGRFSVVAPSGARLPDLTVAVAYAGDHINLTIADGATDFAVGDTFTIAVSGTGKYKMSLAAAVDGSQDPDAILVEDTDATGGDKEAMLHVAGHFVEGDLTIGTGHTAASIREGLRVKGIHI
ncbi:MAG: head decoration protein [Sphingomonadales bacterium]|nr:head decoration protein [Sphingomonadales bacterium]